MKSTKNQSVSYVLINGDRMQGTLLSFTASSHTIQTNNGRTITIPWTSILYAEGLEPE